MKILFDDSLLTVCIKPSGVLSTDGPGGLPELLKSLNGCSDIPYRTVHRLDRVVSGVMVVAKSSAAAAALSGQITDGSFHKEYLAVVHGVPQQKQGTMTDLLFRDSSKNMTYVVKRMRKGVREAKLEYELLESRNGLSLVRIRLLTGRTHQIRAQFSSRGLILAGDRKYGAASDGCMMALWSERLAFAHPESGIRMEFTAPPPAVAPWTEFSLSLGAYAQEDIELPERRSVRETLLQTPMSVS